MIRNYLIILGILLSTLSFAGPKKMPFTLPLSDSSKISIITCSPGEQLYSTFGHSAIRVKDPSQRMDWVFNYGTFDFNTPNFYVKFLSGKLKYQLSISTFSRFVRGYAAEGRMVIEDDLELDKAQRQRLFNLLKENYLPENRKYQYDFFFDNCATRITDQLDRAYGDDFSYIPLANAPKVSFRNLLDEYLYHSDWADFGIDIVLGSVIDRPATPREQTYLPDYLHEYLNHSLMGYMPMVKESKVLIAGTLIIPETPFLLSPQWVFWVLFILLVMATVFYRNKPWIIGDRIIFGLLGFVGLIVTFMWVGTQHDAAGLNFNVLWANPLYLFYVALLGSNKKQLLKYSAIVILVLNSIVLLGWTLLPQEFHPVFVPIIGMLMVRAMVHVLRNHKA